MIMFQNKEKLIRQIIRMGLVSDITQTAELFDNLNQFYIRAALRFVF